MCWSNKLPRGVCNFWYSPVFIVFLFTAIWYCVGGLVLVFILFLGERGMVYSMPYFIDKTALFVQWITSRILWSFSYNVFSTFQLIPFQLTWTVTLGSIQLSILNQIGIYVFRVVLPGHKNCENSNKIAAPRAIKLHF